MTSELLSISIPTYNRANYLRELLSSIEANLKESKFLHDQVKIYIFDNDSTDETAKIVSSVNLNISYKKNQKNIGGDPNIYQAYTVPEGKYIWVIGDDELIPEGTIAYLFDLIKNYNPGLIITKSKEYNAFIEIPLFFENYKEFCLFAEKHNPHLLIAHSLISANIIRKDCFDSQLAHENILYSYAHFYGIVMGLSHSKAPVLFSQKNTLVVRSIRADQRAAPQSNDSIAKYKKTIEDNQIRYLQWLKLEYNLLSIKPDKVAVDYEKKLMFYDFKRKPLTFTLGIIYRLLFFRFRFLRYILEPVIGFYRLMRYGET